LYRAGKHDLSVFSGRRAGIAAVVSAACTAVLFLAGCGNQYRPVVSAINPVGPAGQPTKYAVAISNPNGSDGVTGYSIANNVITVFLSGPNPFLAGQTVGLSGFLNSTFLNSQSVTVLAAATLALRGAFPPAVRDPALAIGGLVLLQYLLGVTALVSQLMDAGVAHQLNAVLLLGCMVWLLHGLRNVAAR